MSLFAKEKMHSSGHGCLRTSARQVGLGSRVLRAAGRGGAFAVVAEPMPPNKRLHPAVRGASLRSAPRPAGEAPAVGRAALRTSTTGLHWSARRRCRTELCASLARHPIVSACAAWNVRRAVDRLGA